MREFDDYLDIILKHEGGYVNDPNDPGGETKYGISARAFPTLDIKNLTVSGARKIYYEHYWLPMKLDHIVNEELKLHLFDMGVNAGIKKAVMLLQTLLNQTVDGVIGNNTLKALINYPQDIVKDYKIARKAYYDKIITKNPKLAKFKKGWYRRVDTTEF